jgi:hypothetical protein
MTCALRLSLHLFTYLFITVQTLCKQFTGITLLFILRFSFYKRAEKYNNSMLMTSYYRNYYLKVVLCSFNFVLRCFIVVLGCPRLSSVSSRTRENVLVVDILNRRKTDIYGISVIIEAKTVEKQSK